jgi:cell wall-associated NlpC family hydrolase
MQVLKKFGAFIIICLFVGLTSYAKTKGAHHKNTGKETIRKEASTSKNHQKIKSISSKKSIAKSTHKTRHVAKAPNQSTLDFQSKELNTVTSNANPLPIENPIALKKESTPNTVVTIDNDLFYTRTVTKTILPKKETSVTAFSSSVMDWVKDKYSCMIEVLPNQISNVMLYRFIDDWYGVKYRMGGDTKKGVDCSAFVQTLYKYVFGLDLLRTACLQFDSSELITNPADLKEGDLVFFKVKSSHISHVGVYLRNNFFVHSASSKGVSIANLSSAYWSKYFAGGGRILPKS